MLPWLSKKILNLCGWQLIGQPPKLDKYIIIVAPHTSNWDFFIFLLLKFVHRIRVNFIGKNTIFVWPFGWFLRRIGGIPVDRSKSHNVVDSIVESFNQRNKMIFALSPEGTRSYHDYWKSGFYHIAINANVPVQVCFLDTITQKLGFGPLINLTGDIDADLNQLKLFYELKKGINPKLFSRIAFQSQLNAETNLKKDNSEQLET